MTPSFASVQPPPSLRAGARIVTIVAAAALLAGCYGRRDITGSVPDDLRQRHPITVQEGDRTVEIFVGSRRGGLNPIQRAEVLAFAQSWKRDATGGILIDLPAGTMNEAASREALLEVRSILAAAAVPPQAIGGRTYQPQQPNLAPIRLNYPRVTASAGPCGLWPDDLGPTSDPMHIQNKQYWNFGCATQRNLASSVAEPADLVQPRATTPAYTGRRTVALDKYRQGQSPATTYTDQTSGKVSSVGQ